MQKLKDKQIAAELAEWFDQHKNIGVSPPYLKVATLDTIPKRDIVAGCYIIGAETSSGKTTAARMIALQCEMQGVPCRLVELDEPGAQMRTPARDLFENPAVMAAEAAKKLSKDTKNISPVLLSIYAFSRYMEMFGDLAVAARTGRTLPPSEKPRKMENWQALAGSKPPGVLVLDSIWQFVAFAASVLDVPSPAKGVHPAYASAVMALDDLARQMKVAIFATQNTTLFPIPNLDGAACGAVTPYAGGKVVMIKDRNDRVPRSVAFSDAVWSRIEYLRNRSI